MYSLLIETSTDQGLLAFFKERQLIFQGDLPTGYLNSKYLLPQIERGLKSCCLDIKEFSYIGVGIGPGSYTGIRVGAMVAKSLAFAAEIPLIGICTLETFIPMDDVRFAVLIDAKIGGAYVITGQRCKNQIRYFSNPEICELGDLERHLKNIDVIITSKSIPLEQKLKSIYPENQWKWLETKPDAAQMDSLALSKFLNKEYSLDGQLTLLYMRKTQAEIEYNSK
jgi:tRNA threonylcarbamoyladenosine biosynthesis protein TsaB